MRHGDIAPPGDILADPRNPWTRLRIALDCMRAGAFEAAGAHIEAVRHHAGLPADVWALYHRILTGQRRLAGDPAGPVDGPVAYMARHDPRLRRPFRQVTAPPAGSGRAVPVPALPPHVGNGNVHAFLDDAARALAGDLAPRIARVHAVIACVGDTDVQALAQALGRQRFDGRIAVTVFAPPPARAEPGLETVPAAVQDAAAAERLAGIAAEADLVLFLSGRVTLDNDFVRRAAHLAAASDAVVQPLLPLREAAREAGATPFSRIVDKPLSRLPFRDLRGLNMAVPAPLLRRMAGFDPRFESTHFAARELAFRMHRDGVYFVPLAVPDLDCPGDRVTSRQTALYRTLCPNAWDRKRDGRFEVPRVSVYIPAYDAARYLREAIDSVLEQDVADLEVCIADDGSRDATPELLERHYGDDPRVRWQRFANGGIGFASNRAIEMARAPYIGQLDSDDRLKPGAVRRLMTCLDSHPEIVCAYGSCERIDAGGAYVRDEYNWRTFSRQKMMATSIVHHFRMFRRAAWMRTAGFREDIANAVDYDIFLKLSEIGPFQHVDEVLYQRRWHGENTSSRQEDTQTLNTHRVQRDALRRMGLDRFWDLHVPDPERPRRIAYRRRPDMPAVVFWPDYSRSNPYQHLLYAGTRQIAEICAGDIDAALAMLDDAADPGQVTFHLHWLNFLLLDVTDPGEARMRVTDFLARIETFVWKGGRLVWTIHNTVSHDSPFRDLEVELSNRIAAVAHVLHFHSAASVDEAGAVFDVPPDKVRLARHGSYLGVYPDFMTRTAAREQLGLAAGDDVILFSGQVRPYKGVEQLLSAFRRIRDDRPQARLLIAGEMKTDLLADLVPALGPEERQSILTTRRFVTDAEMQLYFRAADIAAYPYQRILTSGSLLLALSFGLPSAIPDVGMTREVLAGQAAGALYDARGGTPALEAALRGLLAHKDAGTLAPMADRARRRAEMLDWPDIADWLLSPPE